MTTTEVERFHLMVNNKSKRIQELVYENTYHVYGVPHVGMNDLVEAIAVEAVNVYRDAVASGINAEGAVRHHFGLDV